MFLNKKVLAAAIVGSLFAAGNAAAVDITDKDAVPVAYASELSIPSDGLPVEPAAHVVGNELQFPIGYASSDTVYVRVELSNGAVFKDSGTIAVSGANSGATVSNINGVGTGVVTFSVKADPSFTKDALVTIPATLTLANKGDVKVTVKVFDSASAARNDIAANLLATPASNATYLTFAPALTFGFDTGKAITAYASVDKAYKTFVDYSATTPTYPTTAVLATGVQVAVDQDVLNADNKAFDSLDKLISGATVSIAGDFTLAAKDATLVTFGGVNATLNSASSVATFKLPAGALTGSVYTADFEVAVNTDKKATIAASDYVATLKPTAQDGYTAPALDALPVGTIKREGTTLQAPLAQIAGGSWIARLALTNTSAAAHAYTITVLDVDGKDVAYDSSLLKGSIPANGGTVIELNDLIQTVGARATLVISVDGSPSVINGAYQIVNPASGSISNHVLIKD